jgi:hypothetical protein
MTPFRTTCQKSCRTTRWGCRTNNVPPWPRVDRKSGLAELGHAQERVAGYPKRWPSYLRGTRRYRFRRFPYLRVYHATPGRIVVLAVAYAKRLLAS